MSFLHEEDDRVASEGQTQELQTQAFHLPGPRQSQRRVTQECTTALSASLRIAAETNQLAQSTAEELRVQTEQIQRIHRDTAETQNQLKTSEYLLKGMKGWWSSLTQLFQEPPKPKPVEISPLPK
eukprot:Blabericola_migrator_1__1189@NODE_1304_length_4852_cov_27_504911_g798_i1_p6_GENE_NODE_1304_length_4852_cov_27_504911_g798_i1NODE_1304_length_4852_cov_27_504911_g798_i1_p6_ORF_typecomplete_len125_score14_79VSNARE_C/PF12352_8/8_7e11Sec20/PF03908_13/1_6e04Sec20/PF03908_13/0_00016HAP1_N/PF04849_13/0_02DUF5089/PF17002_5/3_3e02DUF5089/PF17002_5/0_71TerB_C/PF15615_6/2_3e03TerB_C/PF15615_6/0_25_NODE_1304_length_4852_cov_27_504911_g798_i1338712